MLEVVYSKRYRKSINKYSRSARLNIDLIESVIFKIARGEKLEDKYKDHQLFGKLLGYRECHIKSDLLLIYRIYKDESVLLLFNLGSHSELFG